MTGGFANVILEFSPTTDPLDPPVWEDITAYLRSFSISRGRSRTADRVEAGLATIVLDNNAAEFDPLNLDGTYFPNIRPMRRIRLRADSLEEFGPFTVGESYLGETEVLGGSSTIAIGLFSGYVEEWALDWTPQPAPRTDATATVHAVDAFRIFSELEGINAVASTTGVAIAGMLDDHTWPVADENLEDGVNLVDFAGGGGANLLQSIQDAEVAEDGMFFMSADGKATFYAKNHITANPPRAGQTWGDVYGERPYQHIEMTHDESSLWNHVTVTGHPGWVAVYGIVDIRDSISMQRYLERSLDLTTSNSSFFEAQEMAYNQLAEHSVPRLIISRLDIGVRNDLDWDDILSHELFERIVIRRRTHEDDSGIEQDSVIQGIRIESGAWHDWRVTWNLSATPEPNRLFADQASFEGSNAGWAAVSNCTISRQTVGGPGAYAPHGTSYMRMVATANGTMIAHVVPVNLLTVTPGNLYSAMASFISPSTPCYVQVVWLDSSFAAISSVDGEQPAVTGFTDSSLSAIAPPLAVYAELRIVVEGMTAAANQGVDAVGFVNGEQTGWSPGVG